MVGLQPWLPQCWRREARVVVLCGGFLPCYRRIEMQCDIE